MPEHAVVLPEATVYVMKSRNWNVTPLPEFSDKVPDSAESKDDSESMPEGVWEARKDQKWWINDATAETATIHSLSDRLSA